MIELQVPDAFQLQSASQWFSTWSRVVNEPELSLSFVKRDPTREETVQDNPALVVLLAASLASRYSKGLKTEIAKGGKDFVLGVVAMHLLGRGTGSAIEVNEDNKYFQLLRAIIDLRAARDLAERAGDIIEHEMPTPSPSIVRMARFVFEELGANVVDHSGRATTGFGFVHVDAIKRRLAIAFADCGVGFFASLQRNPEFRGRIADDGEAIRLALEPGVSGSADARRNMGLGLKELTRFADALHGDMYIASGSSMLIRKTVGGDRVNACIAIAPWQGAWICLDAPLP